MNNIVSNNSSKAFDDMLSRKTSTDFTCDGKCSRCGGCCSVYLPTTDAEINAIKAYVKQHNIGPCKHNQTRNPMADMVCPFLKISKSDTKCMIYDVRPEICKAYTCGAKPMEIAQRMISNDDNAQKLLQSVPRNIGQLVFPQTYLPKPGDFVVASSIFAYLPDSKIKPGDMFVVSQNAAVSPLNAKPDQRVMVLKSVADRRVKITCDISLFVKVL